MSSLLDFTSEDTTVHSKITGEKDVSASTEQVHYYWTVHWATIVAREELQAQADVLSAHKRKMNAHKSEMEPIFNNSGCQMAPSHHYGTPLQKILILAPHWHLCDAFGTHGCQLDPTWHPLFLQCRPN